MKELNRKTATQAKLYTEKIIQFGEGNFLRCFIDWIVWNMNQKINFDGSVVVVQPIEKGMIEMLNKQDSLYHVNIQGLENGKPVNTLQMIDVISRNVNPYTNNDDFMKIAEVPTIRFVISNTTEAGISYDETCKLTDKPASSYPGNLTQLLSHPYNTFTVA